MFKKPGWQHEDPQIRARAVAANHDAALNAALPRLAREDESEQVRLAAIARLDDILLELHLAHEDSNERVRETCWKRVRSKLSGQATTGVPDLDERIALTQRLDDIESVRFVACNAMESQLREAAAAKLDEPALWLRVAQNDPDAGLRRAAAEKIQDPALLERLAASSRRRDKSVHRLVSDRLSKLRARNGDTQSLEHCAAALCERMQALMTNSRRARAADYREIDQQWQDLHLPADHELQQAYARAAKVVGLATGELQPDTPPPAESAPETASSDDAPADLDDTPDPALPSLLKAVKQLSPDQDKATAFKNMEARINAMHRRCDVTRHANRALLDEIEHAFKQARSSVAEARARHQARLDEFEQIMGEAEKAVAARQLVAAVDAMNRIQSQKKTLGKLPEAMNRHLNLMSSGLAELRSWQRWADNEARRKLCEHVERVVQERPHPDALVVTIRKLKQQWQEMDHREAATEISGRPGGGRLRGRFFRAVDAAMRPAKPYFERRDDLREQHLDELKMLAGELREAASGALKLDWKAMQQLLRRGRSGMRDLPKLPPKHRKHMAAELKSGISALSERLSGHHDSVARLKEKLLAKAQGLAECEEPARAARQATALQKEWQALGTADRKRDQRLWQEFRPLLDAAFHLADAERNAMHETRNAALDTLKDLCGSIEVLVGSARKSGDALDETALHRLQGQWEALAGDASAGLKQRYATDIEKAESLIQEQGFARRKAELASLLANSAALAKQEEMVLDGNSEELPVQLRQTLQSQAEFSARMTFLQQGAKAMRDAVRKNASAAADLVLRMEIAADLESPEDCQAARMNIKVNALARQLNEQSSVASVCDQAQQLILEWCRLGPLGRAQRKEMVPRADAALQRLLAQQTPHSQA